MPVWTTKIVLDKSYGDEAVKMINRAEKDIRVLAYAWRWYPEEPETEVQKINSAIMRALTRGVKVRAICSTRAMALVLCRYGIEARYCTEGRTVHTKAIGTDDRQIMLGSHNLTKRALLQNYEMSMYTTEYEPVVQFSTYFDKMYEASYAP